MASKPWADGPFKLIETPSNTMDIKTHSAIHAASEMSHAHNMLIRGLNSIYLQAPHVHTATDIQDFLFYVTAWVRIVEFHHDTEENTLFPALERFTQKPDIMEVNERQHEEFLPGLHRLLDYARTTAVEAYSGMELRAIVDGFAEALMRHLNEEIGTLLELRRYDSDGLMGLWKETEDVATGGKRPDGMFDIILPCVLGCADRTYEGGIHKFPPFPFFMPYLIDYWFARKHRGAWRFCPCDMYGQPRPLEFVS